MLAVLVAIGAGGSGEFFLADVAGLAVFGQRVQGQDWQVG